MKSLLTAILLVTNLGTAPAHAQGLDIGDILTGIATIGGGVLGYNTCKDERGVVQLFCTGAGAGLGYILGRAVTDRDEKARIGYYDRCMDAYQCGRHQLQDSRNFVEFRQGQRAYWHGRPNLQCRSYTETITNRRGRILHQETKFACREVGKRRWRPVSAPNFRHMRFYNGEMERDWRYDERERRRDGATGPVTGGPGGHWQTRPVTPAPPQQPPTIVPAPPQQPQRRQPAPDILPYQGSGALR